MGGPVASRIALRLAPVLLLSALLPAGGLDPAEASGGAGLAVALTSPAPGATLASTTNVAAGTTWGGAAVAGVQFLLDGGTLGPEDTSPPYEIPWDTRGVEDGPHRLSARARDVAGGVAESAAVDVTVANGDVPTVVLERVEETSVTLAPDGAWPWTTTADLGLRLSGDRAVYAADAGAAASLTFTGTGIRWIGFPCEACGVAEVLVDGARVATVDTYAAARPDESVVMFTSPALAPGTHTIEVEATGEANTSSNGPFIVVDALEPTLDGPPGACARYEEPAAVWAPDATWTRTSDDKVGVAMSGGWAVDTAEPGATVTFTFTGTSVRWIGFPCEICGIADVLIDGVRVAGVDTYAPERPPESRVLYTSPRLSRQGHTLAIEVTGTRNPASGDNYIVVDAFEPLLDDSPTRPVRLEEIDAVLAPEGSWLDSASPADRVALSGGWAASATATASSARFDFVGTSVEWIGFPCETCGIADVLIDGAHAATVDTYAAARPPGSVTMYASPPLSPGPHALDIVATGGANPASAGDRIVVDALEPALDGPIGARVRYEETAMTLSPGGLWAGMASEDFGATMSRDRGVYASERGATATLDFFGAGVRWLGLPCPVCGQADVLIDGLRVATVDTYAPGRPAASRVVYESGRLTPGAHTLAIEVAGAANVDSGGTYVVIDAAEPLLP